MFHEDLLKFTKGATDDPLIIVVLIQYILRFRRLHVESYRTDRNYTTMHRVERTAHRPRDEFHSFRRSFFLPHNTTMDTILALIRDRNYVQVVRQCRDLEPTVLLYRLIVTHLCV